MGGWGGGVGGGWQGQKYRNSPILQFVCLHFLDEL